MAIERRVNAWKGVALASLAMMAACTLTDAQEPKLNAGKPPLAVTVRGEAKVPPDTAKRTADNREVRHGADPLPTSHRTNLPAHTMTLVVLDAEKGLPIADAEIFAPVDDWRKGYPRRITDAQGRYLLQVPLPPQEARVRMANLNFSISHPEFASRGVAWSSSSGDVYASLPHEVTIKLEKGVSIGGVVRDGKTGPLAGVKVLITGSGYRGFTMGTGEKKVHEYPQMHRTDVTNPPAITDENGRWSFAHFPAQLDQIAVTFVRPDESRESFSTSENQPLNPHPLIEFAQLKALSATVTLRGGVTVRGRVVDEAGHPLARATVKEGYGHGSIQRVSEFTTGDDGRFERLNRAPRQWIYTATAEGHATVSVVAQVEAGMSEVKIVLPSAKPMRLRVMDEESKPIADADIRLDSYRNEGQILDWEAKTDPAGRAVWTNAPTALVTFYASADGRGRKFKAQASDQEQLIIIHQHPSEKVIARIRAFDAATREPVKMDSVAANINGDFRPKILARPAAAQYAAEIKQSDVTVGNYPSFTLTMAAEGYQPFTTGQLDFDEGDREVEVAMVRVQMPSTLKVMLPDGKPAEGARVWVRPNENAGAVFANAANRYYGDRWEKAQVGPDGSVKLPSAVSNAPVIITHTNGFLETSLAAIQQSSELKLQSWARIEGRLLVAGKPKSGVMVYLSRLVEPFHLIYNVTSAEDGSFLFTNVPAGQYLVYRRYNSRMGAITPSHQMPITVQGGEKLKLDYAIAGRAVVGQAIPDPADIAADWLNDTHVLAPKTHAERPHVNREDYATFEAFRVANAAWFTSASRIRGETQARNYELLFERDGSFHADDVPPGTYELRIKLTRSNGRSRFGPMGREEELGSIVREVTVPAGNGAFDVGTIAVPMKAGELVAKAAPVALKAQSLEGKDVSISDFRGKHVLVAFWAAWSQNSTDQLAELNKLQKELGREDRLAFLSISLDDDVPTARKAGASLGRGWNLARLEGRERADVTAAFGVETLPAIFLLDPEGRIVGRDLEGTRVRTAVERALKKLNSSSAKTL